MREFLRLGDGVPLTTVTLLVLGPVLFGLVLAVLYPVLDPSWWNELVVHPVGQLNVVIWLFVMLNALFRPTDLQNDEGQVWTGLSRAAEFASALALGVVLCLMIVVDRHTSGTRSENAAVYVALGLTVLSIVLRWHDRRERKGFGRDEASELS